MYVNNCSRRQFLLSCSAATVGGLVLSNRSLEVGLHTYAASPPVGIYFDYHGATDKEPVFIDHPHVDGVFVRAGWAQIASRSQAVPTYAARPKCDLSALAVWSVT